MTDFSTVPDAPRSDTPDLLAALAAELLAINYTVDGVAELLGVPAHEALGRDQSVPAALVLRDRTEPLAVVVRLWLLAQSIPATELAVCGNQQFRGGIFHTELQRLSRKSAEDERVDGADAGHGQSDDNSFHNDR